MEDPDSSGGHRLIQYAPVILQEELDRGGRPNEMLTDITAHHH